MIEDATRENRGGAEKVGALFRRASAFGVSSVGKVPTAHPRCVAIETKPN